MCKSHKVSANPDGYIFVSLNATHLPPVPKYEPYEYTDDDHQLLNIKTIRTPSYLQDDYYYIAFFPLNPRYNGSLVECLSYPRNGFPIDHIGNGYFLAEEVRTKWESLEQLLASAVGAVLSG